MKKFAGNRPLAEIIANAKAQGVAVDDYNYRVKAVDRIAFGVADKHECREDGSPLVKCSGADQGWVLYSTFNGTFWGQTERGIKFTSTNTDHEAEPWFQQLLAFFYAEKADDAVPHKSTMVDYTLGGDHVLRDGGGKKVATMRVKRIPGGADVTIKAAPGVDLRPVVQQLTASPPPRDRRGGGLYQVDSSDGGAY